MVTLGGLTEIPRAARDGRRRAGRRAAVRPPAGRGQAVTVGCLLSSTISPGTVITLSMIPYAFASSADM